MLSIHESFKCGQAHYLLIFVPLLIGRFNLKQYNELFTDDVP